MLPKWQKPTQRRLQAINLDKYDWKKKKNLNKQTLHYFLKLSVAAELKRTELELFCTIVFSWIYISKTRALIELTATRKKNEETQRRYKTFTEKTKKKTKQEAKRLKREKKKRYRSVSLTEADVY